MIKPSGKVAVLGCGVSGLLYAYFLTKLRPDVSIRIYDRATRAGGWIHTAKLQDKQRQILLEKGPRTLRGVSPGTLLIVDTLKQLGYLNQIEVLPKTAPANKKYILNGKSRLVQVPDGFKTFLGFAGKSGLVLLGFVRGIMKEPFVGPTKNRGDELVASFFERRFGSGALVDRVLSAVVHGIYAGDTTRLSVRSLFPRLVNMETEHGLILKAVSNMISAPKTKPVIEDSLQSYEARALPGAGLAKLAVSLSQYPMLKLRDGLEAFPRAIFQQLKRQPNVEFCFGSHISNVDITLGSVTCDKGTEQFDHVRSTIPTIELAGMVSDQKLSSLLSSIEYADILLINVYAPKHRLCPSHGFGFLVPRATPNPHRLLGVIYDSDVEKSAVLLYNEPAKSRLDISYSKITLMLGGHFYASDAPSIDDHSTINMVRDILTRYCSVDLADTNLVVRDESKSLDKTVVLGESDILVSYNYHHKCIPQYNVGYEETKKEILDMCKDTRILFGGTALARGVGVPDCVLDAWEAADKIAGPPHEKPDSI